MQDFPKDTFNNVLRIHACVFVDELALTHGISILKPCEGYGRFVKIKEIGKPHARLIYSPLYSLLTIFAIFGLVLQDKRRKDNGNFN